MSGAGGGRGRGTPATLRCAACDAALRPGLRYCTLCGVELAGARPPHAPLELPPARILATHESELVEEIPLRSVVTTIGRDPGNDVVLPTRRASLRHARIVYRGGMYRLEDLGSVNGTQLDGEPVHEPQPLKSGAIIRIGTSILKFQAGPEYR